MMSTARLPGDWIPTRVSASSDVLSALLVFCSCITSTTFGYDSSMMNGLNILPSYTDYFSLNNVTIGLSTASLYIGGCLAGMVYGPLTDALGRRAALLWAAVITIVAVVLQTASQHIAMFVIARILVGFGTAASGLTGPAYLAETLPSKRRAWGLGVFNDFYYVGGLLAAGITLGTSKLNSTWAWRIPSAIQGVFSIICIVIIPFLPESPRWLLHRGHPDRALTVLGQTIANGDVSHPDVRFTFDEIAETLRREEAEGQQLTMRECVRTPLARKRILLACSAALFSTIAGNVIASYYLGAMLTNAGVTDATTQLQINVILNAFCLVCSLVGTYAIDVYGRRPTALISQGFLTLFLFLVGGLTKAYGTSSNHSGVYGTVACIFLFLGSYSYGWTPVLYLYPPEVLNYAIRANGMGIFTFVLNAAAILFIFAMPTALDSMGWKLYMLNGAWDVVIFGIIWATWVETRGKTLEEVDEALGGGALQGLHAEDGSVAKREPGGDAVNDEKY